jgi:hypothetical protein
MGARDGIFHDVSGAPFKIGDRVKVVSLADDTADAEFLGQQGQVLYYEYSCGCGQSLLWWRFLAFGIVSPPMYGIWESLTIT